jgi:hypothetical protein
VWQSKLFTEIVNIKSFHVSIFLHFSVYDLTVGHPQSILVQKKSIPVTVSLEFTAYTTMYEGESNKNLESVWKNKNPFVQLVISMS